MVSSVEDYIEGVKRCLAEISRDEVEGVVKAVVDAFKRQKRVFVFGNGGSASTSSHFACDLGKGTAVDNKIMRLPVLSLTDNVALITAIANDIGYSSVFKEQLASLLSEGDVVIGISASGNSPNVLEAIEYAKSKGATTIGICGFGGGKLAQVAERTLVFSAKDYGQVEDAHMVLLHFISREVRRRIAGGDRL